MKSNKILVTGAAGFIGYHVCKNLLEEGYNVIGIDNLNSYYDPKLKKSRLENLIKISKEYCVPFDFHSLSILHFRNPPNHSNSYFCLSFF